MSKTMNYSQTTKAVKVTVQPLYLEDQSEPDKNHFMWAYYVRIENKGKERIQLLNRYWEIVEANGTTHEVHGPGVVGEQPFMEPGECFEYTSGTPLKTSSGFMRGAYEVTTDTGECFDVMIPAFSLDTPFEPRMLQ